MQALSATAHLSSRGATRGPRRAMSSSRGRGQRGGGRGRGASRGMADGTSSGGRGQERPRLTHFLSIPLGHLPDLRTRVSAFTSSLLANDPPLSGLDESIVIPPRRLHLTLGVMSLADSAPEDSTIAPKTLETALALLTSLRTHILAILNGQPLHVPLEVLDIMRPHRGGAQNAHVMFTGPDPDAGGEDNRKLRAVCELINTSFIQAGLVEDERRPLKLHCTLLNTVYRKPRARDGQRVPFDFDAILASDAFMQISAASQRLHADPSHGPSRVTHRSESLASSDVPAFRKHPPVTPSQPLPPIQRPAPHEGHHEHGHHVDLGSYVVNEVQICLMGSCGPQGEYISVGGIRLDEDGRGTRVPVVDSDSSDDGILYLVLDVV